VIAAWLLAAAIAAEPAAELERDDDLDCSISVNGRGEASIEPGIPVVLDAIAVVPAERKTVTTKLKVTLAGKEQAWPLVAAGTTTNEEGEREALFTLAAEATKTLAAGDYAIAFVMEEKEKPVADCAPAILHVTAAGKLRDEVAFAARLDYELVSGHKEEAAEIAKAWVEKKPESIDAMLGAGDAAMAAGRPRDALPLYEKALRQALKSAPAGAEPPMAIFARRDAADRALADAK
jgi:tetratricopeptide (TPR) repeat protein